LALARLPDADDDLPRAAALVADDEPTDTVLRQLTSLRRNVPALPIVLFPPARPGIMEILPRVGSVSGTRVVGYWGDRNDGPRLRACLEYLLASAPGAAVLRALHLLLPNGGLRRPLDIARAVIRLPQLGARQCRTPPPSPPSEIAPPLLKIAPRISEDPLRAPHPHAMIAFRSTLGCRMPSAARILLAIRDSRAAAVATAVSTQLGFPPTPLARLPDADDDPPRAAALITDDEPTDAVLRRLSAFRRRAPALPIVLFPPVHEGILEVVQNVGGGSGSNVVGCWGKASDAERLRDCLERLLVSAPGAAVLRALAELLPTGGPRRPLDIARAVLHLRARGERVTVASVAQALGVAPRTLQRRWPTRLPPPHEFFELVTLIYALYVHEWGRAGWERIAHSLGTEPATLRTLRRRWVPAGSTADELGVVVVALAEQVGIGDRRAEDALELLRGTGT